MTVWNDSVRLERVKSSENENGFKIKEKTYTESIPASRESTSRADETLASQSGYTADCIIEIMSCNYAGEKVLLLESENSLYDVKRVHMMKGTDKLHLTCERRTANGRV